MKETYHIEGMGVMGCLLACKLHSEGVSFTWHDTDSNRNSWSLSTGAIMPFGDAASMMGLRSWMADVFGKERTKYSELLRPYMSVGTFVYRTSQPPHTGYRYGVRPVAEAGSLRVSNAPTMHLDVQSFVLGIRHRFRKQRLDNPPGRTMIIVSHGFGSNIASWSWGWSAIVEAKVDKTVKAAVKDAQKALKLSDGWDGGSTPATTVCYYLRQKFQLPYLYPVGNREDRWYAGTILITQKQPRELPIQDKYDTWFDHIVDYSDGLIKPTRIEDGTLRQGWRPMAAADAPLIEKDRTHVYIAPQYGNGIRMWPNTWQELEAVL